MSELNRIYNLIRNAYNDKAKKENQDVGKCGLELEENDSGLILKECILRYPLLLNILVEIFAKAGVNIIKDARFLVVEAMET